MRLLLRFGLFQFTHPRGVRRFSAFFVAQSVSRFNSRTREGCDDEKVPEFGGIEVSIHAPARGATLAGDDAMKVYEVSIHAPARGATVPNNPINQSSTGFNSRTREGCDYLLESGEESSAVSIHAPARGATLLTF